MRILAIQVIRALIPTSIITYVWAFLQVMEEEMRWSSEVLLAMRIVALTPFMLFIDVWAKTSLV